MTEGVEQRICIKICIKLEHSSTETIPMIQKAAAMGNWCNYGQLWWSFSTMTCPLMQSVLAKHQITQVTQLPYSPDTAPCNLWIFPKLKSPLKGKRLQTINEIQENTMGRLMATGRTVWSPKVSTLKGTEASLSCVQCFLYLVSSSINASIFYITCLDTF